MFLSTFLSSICGCVWGIWCWGCHWSTWTCIPPALNTLVQHWSYCMNESFSCNYSVLTISSPGFDCKQLPACQLRQDIPRCIEWFVLRWSYLSYLSDMHTHVGVILSSVLRSADGRSPFLLVLDARTFKEVARVEFDGVDIHRDLHGIFAPFSSQKSLLFS